MTIAMSKEGRHCTLIKEALLEEYSKKICLFGSLDGSTFLRKTKNNTEFSEIIILTFEYHQLLLINNKRIQRHTEQFPNIKIQEENGISATFVLLLRSS